MPGPRKRRPAVWEPCKRFPLAGSSNEEDACKKEMAGCIRPPPLEDRGRIARRTIAPAAHDGRKFLHPGDSVTAAREG